MIFRRILKPLFVKLERSNEPLFDARVSILFSVFVLSLFFLPNCVSEATNFLDVKTDSKVFLIRGNDDLVNADQFFNDIYQEFFHEKKDLDVDIIVVGHLIPTLPVYLRALEKIGRIAVIVPKSSSANSTVVNYVQDKILKEVFGLNQEDKRAWFNNKDNVISMIKKYVKNEKFLIIDIGGYFSYSQNELKKEFGERLIGIVEDTENGHQKYGNTLSNVQVISVARSPLKDMEDYNVGKSIVEASDAILRTSAHTMISRIRTIGVIGFGKIGRSIAIHAREKGAKRVLVYDISPLMAIKASALGFEVVDREELLIESEMIFSATGSKALNEEDLKILKDNVFISSCTSSDDEFDLSFFKGLVDRNDFEDISNYQILGMNKRINLLHNGNAVNFIYDAVNGPYIYAVMSSLIISAKKLMDNEILPSEEIGYIPTFGIYGPDASHDVDRISKLWLKNFEKIEIEPKTLSYSKAHQSTIKKNNDSIEVHSMGKVKLSARKKEDKMSSKYERKK